MSSAAWAKYIPVVRVKQDKENTKHQFPVLRVCVFSNAGMVAWWDMYLLPVRLIALRGVTKDGERGSKHAASSHNT